MDIGSGYALTLMLKATEEYMVFYSQEEFDEYIRLTGEIRNCLFLDKEIKDDLKK